MGDGMWVCSRCGTDNDLHDTCRVCGGTREDGKGREGMTTTGESWGSEHVAADLRDNPGGSWRLGAPPPGAPVAEYTDAPPQAHDSQGWRPGAPAPEADESPAMAPTVEQSPVTQQPPMTQQSPMTQEPSEPPDIQLAAPAPPAPAPPQPAPPQPEDWAMPPPAPAQPEPETVVRPLDAPMQARPQPGAPPGVPQPGWSTAGTTAPAEGWQPAAKKRGLSLRLPKLDLKPKAKPAGKPARSRARRGDQLQEAFKGVLVLILIGVAVALAAMPGPIHNMVFKNHKAVNPVEDSNTVSAALVTATDLGSGWQAVSKDVHLSSTAVPARPSTTPSPVAGQPYADFRDCLGSPGGATATGTSLFRAGNNLVLASAWTDTSRGAAGYDLSVTASSSFVSCIKNELEKTANMALGTSLVVPLHKPSVGDQSIAFRVDAGNVTYDLFAAQQGRAVLIVQDIGAGQQLDLSLGVNGLQAMSARLPADL